jgi:hypothetical protein
MKKFKIHCLEHLLMVFLTIKIMNSEIRFTVGEAFQSGEQFM